MDSEELKYEELKNIAEREMPKYLKMLSRGEVPEKYDCYPIDVNGLRDAFKNIGYPLYAQSWIKPLAKWIGKRKCVELMSGTGFLSHALSQHGVNIVATDNHCWEMNIKHSFYDIEQLDCRDAIRKYSDADVFICSWPPYMNEIMTECLQLMRQVNPNALLVYIGEPSYGCCASESFFEAVNFIKDRSFEPVIMGYPRWFGISDWPHVCK